MRHCPERHDTSLKHVFNCVLFCRSLPSRLNSSKQSSVHRGLTCPKGQRALTLAPSLSGEILASTKQQQKNMSKWCSCARSCHSERSGPAPAVGMVVCRTPVKTPRWSTVLLVLFCWRKDLSRNLRKKGRQATLLHQVACVCPGHLTIRRVVEVQTFAESV